jgi:hypothetical protein
VVQLGANAHGEILEPGRVPDCYLGLLLHDANDAQPAGVLVVSPAALLHPTIPQPDGTVLYELVTGHPDLAPQGRQSNRLRRLISTSSYCPLPALRPSWVGGGSCRPG